MARKHTNRKMKDVQNRYDAAGTGRRMSGWNTPASGPNKAIGGLSKIRDRSRDMARNDWSGASVIRTLTTNVIGSGITPRPRTKDAKLKEKLIALWDSWSKVSDADHVLDFAGLQLLAARTWFTSGEVFVRLRPRRTADALPVPLQIQLLEGDMVPMLDADNYPGMPAGNYIRQGIELTPIGGRAAYWMWKFHPGDSQPATILANQLVRVPAEGVLHIYDVLRPGQLRGVSGMATVIPRMRNVADFDDAVLERQKLANLFTLFITKAAPTGNDAMTGLPFSGDPSEPLAGMEPGIAQELLPGEDVRFSDPPDAGANYAEFMRTQNLGVAAGTGTPYELMSGDIKDVSDRTLRVLINEFRRLCEQMQWTLFIPRFCQPIREVWATLAQIDGALTAAEALEATKVSWAPQGWAYVHPVQDVQAKQLEVECGFRSRSSVIAERGDDPDAVDLERADDKERETKLDLVPPAVDPAKEEQDKQDQKDQKAMQNRILALLEQENG